jgi:RNA recognition motif-containing protein
MQYMNLYVKGLDMTVTENEVASYFSEFGEISSLKVVTGAGRAFVCFKDRDGAKAAKE